MRDIDQISGDVLDVALGRRRDLGPGRLESVYETVLATHRGPIRGRAFGAAFRVDPLVDERLLAEINSVERLTIVHARQLLTYLRLTKQPVGLLINFGGAALKEGVRRIVNDHRPPCLRLSA